VVVVAEVCQAWAVVSVSVCLEMPMVKEALLFLAKLLLTSVYLLLCEEIKFSSRFDTSSPMEFRHRTSA